MAQVGPGPPARSSADAVTAPPPPGGGCPLVFDMRGAVRQRNRGYGASAGGAIFAAVNRPGCRPAEAAFVVGIAYAAMNVYWGLGGTWLLNTVGCPFPVDCNANGGRALLLVLAWGAAVLKAVASILPLLVLRVADRAGRWWSRPLRLMVWAEAGILTLYGLVLTTAELLATAGVIAIPAGADRTALTGHAYLWDPWFLVWGMLVTATLLRARPRPGAAGPPSLAAR